MLFLTLLILLWMQTQPAHGAIIAAFEGPEDGQMVSGVGLIRGWAFSDSPGAKITQVTLRIDGKTIGAIPCCSERPDVQAALSQQYPSSNTLTSGFGLVRNYGLHPDGPHTFEIVITDNRGAQQTLTHSIKMVRVGGSEFIDSFDMSAARVELQGQDILLSNLQIRDKETQQLRKADTRLRWLSGMQGLGTVDATTLSPVATSISDPSNPAASTQTLVSELQTVFESPSDDSTVAGVNVLRGWTFAPSGRSIQSVQLQIDETPPVSIPCCSDRPDVAQAYPGEPNARNSGFGITFNYGRLSPGLHTLNVRVEDSTGSVSRLQARVTVVAPGGFEFLDGFDLSTADPRIDGDELVVTGVKVRDKASHQTSFRILRFQWNIAAQSFLLVHDNVDAEQLISDDFEDGEAADWTTVAGQWNVSNGEFINISDQAVERNIAINGPDITDFQLTAQLRSTDNDAIGLVFRFRGLDDYYFVEFNNQKGRVQLQKRAGGVVTPLKSATPFSFTKGVPFEAAVRVRQNRIQVFVNGRTVIDFTDTDIIGGKVGLYSQFNKFAAFDDVHLATLKTVKTEGGNTIYVDAANAGKAQDGQTEATAWATINQALNDPRFRESAGNTVVIKSGLYLEQVNILGRMSGIPGAFNTIRAAQDAQVVIDGEKDTPQARREGVLIHTGVHYIRVEGLWIQHAQHRGILVFESGPGELVGNHIHHCGDSGMEFWFGARHYEVVQNTIYRNEQDGIVLSEGSGDDPSRLGANRAIMMRNNMLFANGPDGGDGIFVQGNHAHSFAIYNNTMVGNSGDGISVDPASAFGDIRNNIIMGHGRIGLKLVPDDPVSRDYNNLFNNGTGGTKNFDGHGGSGKNSINLDPHFVNALAGDLRLQSDSPSLNTGDPAARFNDSDGTRNDMGAYGGPQPLVGVPPLN